MWPQLSYGYVWDITHDIDDGHIFTTLMPGAQGELQVQPDVYITQQEEILPGIQQKIGSNTMGQKQDSHGHHTHDYTWDSHKSMTRQAL